MTKRQVPLLFLWLTMLLSGCGAGTTAPAGVPRPSPATPQASVAARPGDRREAALGEVVAPAAWQQRGGVYPDDKLNEYVTRVGSRLARGSARRGLVYRFGVVNDSTPNVFALPGGFVAVSRGLLVELSSEAQLAAVLGHAIAHVESRHAMEALPEVEAAGLDALSLAERPGYGPRERLPGEVAARLLDHVHNGEQERAADRLALALMVKAGYDPWGMLRLQELLLRQRASSAGEAWEHGWFKNHPLTRDRVAATRDDLRRRYPAARDGGAVQSLPPALARLLDSRRGYRWYDQGRRLERAGKLTEAVAAYLQAAAAAPDEALILTALGMAYLQSEAVDTARMHLSQAVRLDPRYYYSRMGLGYVCLRQGRFAQAIDELEASLRLLPSTRGAYLLADACEKSGDRQSALERYREVIQADPRSKLGKFAAERVRALEEER